MHQPAATNSMRVWSTYAQYLQHLQSEAHLESIRTSVVELSCWDSQRVKAASNFHRASPLLMFDRVLNVTLPNETSPAS